MPDPKKIAILSWLFFLPGCAANLKTTINPPANPKYVTVAVDRNTDLTPAEPELIQFLKSASARVEKDANGDDRIFDSPDCRRVLVQYRRQMRLRIDVIAQNIANINTTHGPNGEKTPYRRKMVVADKTGSIAIAPDLSPFLKRYDPGNPDADTAGYVQYPNVDQTVEFVNAVAASRAYQMANAILQRFDPTLIASDAVSDDSASIRTGVHSSFKDASH